jgi:CubicO group peptidase (beta-lactamase class C family)
MSLWNDALQTLVREALVPGAAAAVVRHGQVAELSAFGMRCVRTMDVVDEHTIFDAASLSKPVFAHLVLQLADRGILNLDMPLNTLLPNYLAASPSLSITPRHILSHSAGLPNWRSPNFPLRTYFTPGERFSYSGEGYLYLQKAIEQATGKTLDELARDLVFDPLGMARSSFIWQRNFEANRAYPHDAFGMPALGNKPGVANAAWSLQTCASDYALFLCAVLGGERLDQETAALWLSPSVEIKHRGIQCLTPSDEHINTGIAWGLGWGLETEAETFFHWGDNGPYTSFCIGRPKDQSAFVVFTNGASGHSVMHEVVERFLPGERVSLKWLDYVRHDAPVRRLLRSALSEGLEPTWPKIEVAALEREQLIWIAQGLNARGDEKASAWLLAKSCEPSMNATRK